MEGQDTGLGLAEFLAKGSAESNQNADSADKTAESNGDADSGELKQNTQQDNIQQDADAQGKETKQDNVQQDADAQEKTQQDDNQKTAELNWDDINNPYKKRYHDVFKWANQVHMQNLQMQKQMEILAKKLDGTYDPEVDEPKIDVNEVASNAEMAGRINASRLAAFEIFGGGDIQKGEQIVAAMLWNENAPFKHIEHLPHVKARVMASPSPVIEAMKIVNEYAFMAKWGKTPHEIEQNIRKAVEKELEDKVTKKLMEKLNLKENQVNGISEARSAVVGAQNNKREYTPLAEIFGS